MHGAWSCISTLIGRVVPWVDAICHTRQERRTERQRDVITVRQHIHVYPHTRHECADDIGAILGEPLSPHTRQECADDIGAILGEPLSPHTRQECADDIGAILGEPLSPHTRQECADDIGAILGEPLSGELMPFHILDVAAYAWTIY